MSDDFNSFDFEEFRRQRNLRDEEERERRLAAERVHRAKLRREQRERKRRQQRIFIGAAVTVLAILIILIVLLCKSCSTTGNSIEGLWSIDGVTKLEFSEDGNGAMVLPNDRYEFTYSIDENMIYIDYADESMGNPSYEFWFEGKELHIKDIAAEYKMTKEKNK